VFVADTLLAVGVDSQWAYSVKIHQKIAELPLGCLKTLADDTDKEAIEDALALIAESDP
jgi:hypothetical protein